MPDLFNKNCCVSQQDRWFISWLIVLNRLWKRYRWTGREHRAILFCVPRNVSNESTCILKFLLSQLHGILFYTIAASTNPLERAAAVQPANMYLQQKTTLIYLTLLRMLSVLVFILFGEWNGGWYERNAPRITVCLILDSLFRSKI